MNHELIQAITALADRLAKLTAEVDGLRDDLRSLAGALRTVAEPPPDITTSAPEAHEAGGGEPGKQEPESPEAVEEEAPPPPPEPAEPPAPRPPEVRTSPLPELTLGRSRPSEPARRPEWSSSASSSRSADSDDELASIEAACRLKAEGVRWAATRRRRIEEGADFRVEIAPGDREILDRAGEIGCYLWMNSPNFVVPRAPDLMEDAAKWFEAVADAAALVRGMLPDVAANRAFFEPALNVLAECQSALRVAIERIGGSRDDDQYRAYDWLRGVTSREQIYISRHMRLDDPADPSALRPARDRIAALSAKFLQVRGRARKKNSGYGRLRYHARRIGEGRGTDDDWRTMSLAIDELIGEGVPVSNVDVRDALLPILDMMPEGMEFSQGFNLALREIDRYIAGRNATNEAKVDEAPSPEVARVADLLRGKSVLLIGGIRRPEAHQALQAAFGLEDLIWFETREHESIDVFAPHIARSDVVLVLLAIRWSSHSFGEVKRFCDEFDKPMVRLPGGYGVNQVAAQILDQCSGRLGDE